MCNWSLNIKSELIEKLNFLVESSLQKKTQQGVFTFTSYIARLNKSDNNSLIYDELYSELSSMQRFASFDRQECLEVQGIFKLIEENR